MRLALLPAAALALLGCDDMPRARSESEIHRIALDVADDVASEKVAALESRVEEMESAVETLQRDKGSLQSEIDSLKSEHGALRSEYDAHRHY